MKKYLILLGSGLILAGCASPRGGTSDPYDYDYYDGTQPSGHVEEQGAWHSSEPSFEDDEEVNSTRVPGALPGSPPRWHFKPNGTVDF